MGTFRPLGTALCAYECLRLAFLVGAFVLLQPAGAAAFPWLAVFTPGALFLLMALFWRVDMSRYEAYCPLYMAGKGIHVITTLFWLFHGKSGTMMVLFERREAAIIATGIVAFLVLGDVLSIALAARITGVFKTVVDFLEKPLFKN